MQVVETNLRTIENTWAAAQRGSHPTALWRLPKSTEKQILIDLSDDDRRGKLDLNESLPGFALGPFINPDGEQTRLLQADLYFRFDGQNQILAEETSPSADVRRVLEFEELANEPPDPKSAPVLPINSVAANSEADPAESWFVEGVQRATEAIRAGHFQKVVLSRKKEVWLPADFSVVDAFNRLCEAYPNAFVSAVSLPNEGTIWLGASPETLVSVDASGIFRTVALAGTQSAFDAAGQVHAPVEVRWSHKEIEEQALVSRYIIGCFKKIRLREYIENGPKTVRAGNLMHLRTDYAVDTEAVNFPQLGTVMLDLLHPTSAVCGMPKVPALDFIQQHEGYDREWYSGFLGPVNIDGESHLFVNLRTMKVAPTTVAPTATLYAGAGITEDSLPEREWRETELKCQTLLNVIGGESNH
ncbi:MAG: chorismate-binding protein [Cytophagaceae bacterium]|nr:chorismate-binding protein [Cytophagaceae bacterium]